jgi:hypothetical protein
MTPPKLTVDSEGRVHGANVSHNSPWPCGNGHSGRMVVPSGVKGAVMHTMAGYYEGTIAWFNNPKSQVSAHFGVAWSGQICQFGPVNGWMALAQKAGNPNWYSIEFEDDLKSATPLTQAQIDAGAQLLECLSASSVGNFPMQITNTPGTEGFGWHGMGGNAWGHLDCPGDVRKAQRQKIIDLAKAIRTGGEVAVYTCEGQKSLDGLSQQLHCPVSTILQLTAEHSPEKKYYERMADYLNGVFAADTVKVPEGINVYHPELFHSHGTQTLQGLANAFGCKPADIVQYTAENSPGAEFGADMAKYLDDVFSNSDTHVPAGIHLYYEK